MRGCGSAGSLVARPLLPLSSLRRLRLGLHFCSHLQTNQRLNPVFIFPRVRIPLRLTGAVGATLTTWGLIPDTGMAPLGGRFLLVTDAQENGCGRAEKGVRTESGSGSVRSTLIDLPCSLLGRSERVRPAPKLVLWWAVPGRTTSSPSARQPSAFLSGRRGCPPDAPLLEPPGLSRPLVLDWPLPPHCHRGLWAQNC